MKQILKEQGLTFCRKEKKKQALIGKTSEKYCKICKKKIRGKNHNEGRYHKQAKKG